MEPRVCTFDFDETLFIYSSEKVGLLWTATEVLVPVQKIHDLVLEKHNKGFVIDIVTSRYEWDVAEIEAYVTCFSLPIRNIHYTAGKPKASILKKIQSTLHIDDNLAVAIDCKMNDIPVLLVDDGKHKNNITAHEFDRIFI